MINVKLHWLPPPFLLCNSLWCCVCLFFYCIVILKIVWALWIYSVLNCPFLRQKAISILQANSRGGMVIMLGIWTAWHHLPFILPPTLTLLSWRNCVVGMAEEVGQNLLSSTFFFLPRPPHFRFYVCLFPAVKVLRNKDFDFFFCLLE